MISVGRLSNNFLFLFCTLLLLLGGCTTTPLSNQSLQQQHLDLEEEDAVTGEEQVDIACSYFYFLWACHAENNKEYNEAQEAYEKALICDPDSRYVLRKLPLLLIKMGKYQGAAQWLRKIIADNPDDIQDRLLLARLDVRNNEIEEAIQLYKEIIELTPEDETVLLRLGFIYSQQNRYNEAEKTFRQALAQNHESLFAHLYLARLATQKGDYIGAATWYEKALDLNWSADLAIELAEFFGVLGKYDRVEALYRSVLEQTPDDEQASLGLVHTLLLQDREEDALQELRRLRELSQEPEHIDMIISRLFLRSGKLDEAAEILEPIVQDNESSEAAYMLAVIRYEKKNFTQALEILQKILPDSDSYQDSISLQVRILLEEKQEHQAIAMLKQILTDEVGNTPALYALLASLYMEQNQIEEGYKTIQDALNRYPDNEQLYFEYGLLLEQDGKQQQAIVSMEKVLELQPDHAEALNYLGYTWADNNVNLEKALQYIQQSLTLKPNNGFIRDSLGWVYFRLGKLDKAVEEILGALELEPDDPNIYEHLGDIYRAQGKNEDARKAYQKAGELFVDQDKKLRIQEKTDGLQGE
ncbi:MAG: tetratricopeptide repeat protein [Proteobacteria bacterium]|nr:tetratricopeptide repeat protein [Pseudomonadota bacterium]MBU1419811.1 tetratricopeptide repeat protein [Pseudomonadota bacterium]MBU1456779.1 tetratricopeptide repeat protein [Pseudomonadota bacterium]